MTNKSILEKVEKFLESNGFTSDFLEQDDDFILTTGYTLSIPDFGEVIFFVYIYIIDNIFGDQYVRIVVTPYPFSSQAEEQYRYDADLIYELLYANHDLTEVKFAIDGEGGIELLVDVPLEKLSHETFFNAFDLLTDYCADNYGWIVDMLENGE